MGLAITSAWQEEVNEFLASHVTQELLDEVAESWEGSDGRGGQLRGPLQERFRQDLAATGWLGLTWPAEYGGMERSSREMYDLMDLMEYWDVPPPDLTTTSVGPAIIRHGSPAQRREWLPRIRSGEMQVAVAYSEPDAGSDLANMKTSARRDGDEWVINGQKLWNSRSHFCTHEWLACRTDPAAKSHAAISIFIVPLDSEGIEIRPIRTWGDHRTNEAFFIDVRVPHSSLVGPVNGGWDVIRTALSFERVKIGTTGEHRRLYDAVLEACSRTTAPHGTLIDDPGVRRTLMAFHVDLERAAVLGRRIAAMIDEGKEPVAEASMAKVFSTELRARLADFALSILGPAGHLRRGDHARDRGRIERAHRRAVMFTFAGGANEIQRDIIARRHLGMPSSRAHYERAPVPSPRR